MLFYQFMHSSESILGVQENSHIIHPPGIDTFFFRNPHVWLVTLSREKLEPISFQKHVGFLVIQLYPLFFFAFLFVSAISFKRVKRSLGMVDA